MSDDFEARAREAASKQFSDMACKGVPLGEVWFVTGAIWGRADAERELHARIEEWGRAFCQDEKLDKNSIRPASPPPDWPTWILEVFSAIADRWFTMAHELATCGHARANYKDPAFGSADYKGDNTYCWICRELAEQRRQLAGRLETLCTIRTHGEPWTYPALQMLVRELRGEYIKAGGEK